MAKKGRNVARKTMSRSDDLLEAAGFLAAPEAQKKRIEDALAEAMTTDPIPRPKMRPKKIMKPKRRPEEMENGGLAGGQKKLDKNKDGKISGEDFRILRGEKKSTKGTKVKKMQGGGQVCRGGGAAVSGTKFSGVR
jgi:hypothetical protein